ncbi:MAG: hypothetical protein Q4C13_08365, partial [Clostridia bacterium]|nr:hypothetical protein [Clostridia bacterium]
RVAENGLLTAAVIAGSLAAAALPAFSAPLPLVSVLVKITQQSGFPLLPYAGYFALGMYLAGPRRAVNRCALVFSACAFAGFLFWLVLRRELPTRFPPSLPWVAGAYLPVYLLYLLFRRIHGCRPVAALLCPIGRETLFYLTFSNLLLAAYTAAARASGFTLGRPWYLPGFALLLFICLGGNLLYRFLRQRLTTRHEPPARL